MRRERLYLADMLEACDDVGEFVRDIDFEQFTQSKLVKSAVLQKLIVIGEAAARLPAEFTVRYDDVEWAEIAAFRNRLVHGYFNVEWSIVWTAATEEVPLLRQHLVTIIKREDREVD
jgi:uncharacterized protein with HEPN domain